jgi:hypothetical protein
MQADHSMGADESVDPDETADCEDAFAGLDLADLAGLTDLDAASDVLDDTIAACGSVAAWEAQLGTALPMLTLDDAEEFLAARCGANEAIADSPICGEIS